MPIRLSLSQFKSNLLSQGNDGFARRSLSPSSTFRVCLCGVGFAGLLGVLPARTKLNEEGVPQERGDFGTVILGTKECLGREKTLEGNMRFKV